MSRVTERCGNLRKDLKKEILEAVSSLRYYLAQVQTHLEAKTASNKDLELEVKSCKAEIQWLQDNACTRTRRVAPSLETARRETNSERQVLTPGGDARKLYSEAVQSGRREKRYKLMISSTEQTIQQKQTKT